MGFFNRIADGLFFETDHRQYWDYRRFGLEGERFVSVTGNGTEIPSLFLRALPRNGGKVRGTVLYAYDGTRNASFHLPQISWLVPGGWNVVLFDPPGAGESEGTTSLDSYAEAACGAYDAVLENKTATPQGLVLFGQGVGGAAVLEILARHPEGAAGVVLEGTFARRRSLMLRRYGPGVGHLAASLLTPSSLQDPADIWRGLRIPAAYLRPGRDSSVPEKELSDMVNSSPAGRTIWNAAKEKHLTAFGYPTEWRDRFLEFADSAVKKAARKK